MELLRDLNRDPWSLGYKIAMERLIPRGTSPLSLMNYSEADSICEALFPAAVNETEERLKAEERISEYEGLPIVDPGDEIVTNEVRQIGTHEVSVAIKKMCRRRKAPGSDGVFGVILRDVFAVAPQWSISILNECLKIGYFPVKWKRAKVVLLRKNRDSSEVCPSAFRPLCLLNEISKLLERIICTRAARRFSTRLLFELGDVHTRQYGFRINRSTCDALRQLKDVANHQVRNDGRCLVISLDVKNAFNTLSWKAIREALTEKWKIPKYLVMILFSYLKNREITAEIGNSCKISRSVERGVSQGSVLGPMIWHLTYDSVVRTKLPLGCGIMFCR